MKEAINPRPALRPPVGSRTGEAATFGAPQQLSPERLPTPPRRRHDTSGTATTLTDSMRIDPYDPAPPGEPPQSCR
jgi:hypothetical protein